MGLSVTLYRLLSGLGSAGTVADSDGVVIQDCTVYAAVARAYAAFGSDNVSTGVGEARHVQISSAEASDLHDLLILGGESFE